MAAYYTIYDNLFKEGFMEPYRICFELINEGRYGIENKILMKLENDNLMKKRFMGPIHIGFELINEGNYDIENDIFNPFKGVEVLYMTLNFNSKMPQ